jgi:hypothetical protein
MPQPKHHNKNKQQLNKHKLVNNNNQFKLQKVPQVVLYRSLGLLLMYNLMNNYHQFLMHFKLMVVNQN